MKIGNIAIPKKEILAIDSFSDFNAESYRITLRDGCQIKLNLSRQHKKSLEKIYKDIKTGKL